MIFSSVYLFICILAAADSDRDFNMCGTWLHSGSSRTLDVHLTKGCSEIVISANASTLSVRGSLTAQCVESRRVALSASGESSSSFCVFWEPLLDRLMVKLNGKDFGFCEARGLQTHCCTHLSIGLQQTSLEFGIVNTSIHGDPVTSSTMAQYQFNGEQIDCSKFPSAYLTSFLSNL